MADSDAVDDFRAEREKRKNARRRDRGGIFQPLEKNGLLDVLMARRKSGRVSLAKKSSSPARMEDDRSDQPRKKTSARAGRKETLVKAKTARKKATNPDSIAKLQAKKRSVKSKKAAQDEVEPEDMGDRDESVVPEKINKGAKTRRGTSTKSAHTDDTTTSALKPPGKSGKTSAIAVMEDPEPAVMQPTKRKRSAEIEAGAEPDLEHAAQGEAKKRRTLKATTQTKATKPAEPTPTELPEATQSAPKAGRAQKGKQHTKAGIAEETLVEHSSSKRRNPLPSAAADVLPSPKVRAKRAATARVVSYAEPDEDTPMYRPRVSPKAKKKNATNDVEAVSRTERVKEKFRHVVDAVSDKLSKSLRKANMKDIHPDEAADAMEQSGSQPDRAAVDDEVPTRKTARSAKVKQPISETAASELDGPSGPLVKGQKRKAEEEVPLEEPKPMTKRRKVHNGISKDTKAMAAKENASVRRPTATRKQTDKPVSRDASAVILDKKAEPLADKTNMKRTSGAKRKRKLKVPDTVWDLAKYGSRRHTTFVVRPAEDADEDELDLLS